MHNKNMKKTIVYVLILLVVGSCTKTDVTPKNVIVVPPVIKIALISKVQILGDVDKSINDTFKLHFNKPIKTYNIKFIPFYCSPDLVFSLSDSNTTINIYNFLCGRMGADLPFSYSVTDSLDNVLSDTVIFRTYFKKHILNGKVEDYFVTDDNKYCWVATSNPNKIICVGIEDTSYRKEFNIGLLPFRLNYNAYNQKIYILCSDYISSDKFVVFNPVNGNIEKTVQVLPLPTQNTVYLSSICFSKNGIGIIISSGEYSAGFWSIIDSRNNDSVYMFTVTNQNSNIGQYMGFNQVVLNFDKTKLLLSNENLFATVCTFDCNTQYLNKTQYLNSTNPTNCRYIVANKIKDEIYSFNTYSQFIITNNSTISTVSGFQNYYNLSTDFSYRNNEDKIMYYLADYEFRILNYNNRTTLKSSNFSYEFNNLKSTTDGKYIIVKGDSSLVYFKTSMFY